MSHPTRKKRAKPPVPVAKGLEIFAELGPPPKDALAICRWAQRAAALVLHGVMTGVITEDRAAQVRSSVRAVIFALPPERIAEVDDAMKAEAQEMKRRTGGRTPEPVAAGESIYGPPRKNPE